MTEFICPSTVKNPPVSKSHDTPASPPRSKIFLATQTIPNSEFFLSDLCPVRHKSCDFPTSSLFLFLVSPLSHPLALGCKRRWAGVWGDPSVVWRLHSHPDLSKPFGWRLTTDSPHLFWNMEHLRSSVNSLLFNVTTWLFNVHSGRGTQNAKLLWHAWRTYINTIYCGFLWQRTLMPPIGGSDCSPLEANGKEKCL